MTPKTLLLSTTVVLLTGTQALADSFSIVQPGRSSGRVVAPVRPNPPRYPGDGRDNRPGPVRPGPVYPGPVRPGPVYPGPVRPGPVYPGPVYPGPVYPGPIYPNPTPINRYIQKVIYINRYVTNEALYLQQLSDLFYSAQGYRLESVSVEATQIGYGASLQLLINGYIESSDYTVYGVSTLYPNYSRVFGYDLSTLAVQVSGSALINRITVNLRLD